LENECVEMVQSACQRVRWSPWQKFLRIPLKQFSFYSPTPEDRILRAVRRELVDLGERALAQLSQITPDESNGRLLHCTRETLKQGIEATTFPEQELRGLLAAFAPRAPSSATTRAPNAHAEIETWLAKYQAFRKRLTWLLDPELTRQNLSTLDPVRDGDQLSSLLKLDFRPEFLFCAWGLTIQRISQVEPVATFFHATGTAESTPLLRTEDTLIHIYYFQNWGLDSWHGRKAVESMNRIHGRYFIHNDGMKYVLLNGAFTVLDALEVVGNRPLTEQEKLGFFHSHIEMGQAMNIQELTHSWDEMYGWFHGLNKAFRAPLPEKIRMWHSLEDNFDRDAKIPYLVSRYRRWLENTGMEETCRQSLGIERPSPRKSKFALSMVKFVAKMRRALPNEPYIESLQNFISYPNGVDITGAGEKQRSPRLPSGCPFAFKALPESTHPKDQLPLMHVKDAPPAPELKIFSWDEVKKHNTPDDLWVVFGGYVYDLSSFAQNHPGGVDVLVRGSGKDMTRAYEKAKHSDLTRVFALNFRIGRIEAHKTVHSESGKLRVAELQLGAE
jgi:hypothetical protein